METVSEKKPKRGRPPEHSPKSKATLKALWSGDIKTDRSALNKVYLTMGLAHIEVALGMDARAWFLDEKNFHQGLLREIGLMSKFDFDLATEVARMLWKGEFGEKPIHEIIANMRRARIGEKEPSEVDLANRVIHVINEYRKQFPKMETMMIVRAVDLARKQISGK